MDTEVGGMSSLLYAGDTKMTPTLFFLVCHRQQAAVLLASTPDFLGEM